MQEKAVAVPGPSGGLDEAAGAAAAGEDDEGAGRGVAERAAVAVESTFSAAAIAEGGGSVAATCLPWRMEWARLRVEKDSKTAEADGVRGGACAAESEDGGWSAAR